MQIQYELRDALTRQATRDSFLNPGRYQIPLDTFRSVMIEAFHKDKYARILLRCRDVFLDWFTCAVTGRP